MITITEFLLARIAEDEAMACDALRPRYGSERDKAEWLYDGNPSGAFTAGAYTVGEASSWAKDDYQGGRFARHIVNWDPARVLAECEAKRGIIDRYENGDFEAWWADREYPNYVFPFLALPYADHPDYQDDWKPA